MSIYIKGMEMPTYDKGVRTINVYADGVITNYAEETIGEAVPVPPHGRLIDADALADKLRTMAYENDGRSYSFYTTAKAWVDDAPTIIPADTEEKGET